MPSSRRGPLPLPKLPCILMFRQFFLISPLFIMSAYPPPLSPHQQHPPSKKIYRGLFVPTFPKTGSCPLVPYDISPFFYLVPQNPRDTLKYDHTKSIQTHAYVDSHTTGPLKTSVRPSCYLLLFFFCRRSYF